MKEYLVAIGKVLEQSILPILLDIFAIVFGIYGLLAMVRVLFEARNSIDLGIGIGIGAASFLVLFVQRISRDIKRNKG